MFPSPFSFLKVFFTLFSPPSGFSFVISNVPLFFFFFVLLRCDHIFNIGFFSYLYMNPALSMKGKNPAGVSVHMNEVCICLQVRPLN